MTESAKPLAGKRVAVTRAREQAAGLMSRLGALGATPIECPAISIAPLEDFTALDSAIQQLATYDWVIFTSANGVQSSATRMSELGSDPETLLARKLGAIGPATASKLQELARPPDFVPASYVAEAIIEQIGDVRGCRILLPRADIARPALALGLREKGAQVDEVAVYRTVPGPAGASLLALLSSASVDAITFTSSSTVRNTVAGLVNEGLEEPQACDLLNTVALVCIGPITAATAGEYGLKVAAVAEEYTADGLVAALLQLWSPHQEVINA